jgi:hypothetical protein
MITFGVSERVAGAGSLLGVGIHHSSPRAVWMYSGQRKSVGGWKSLGSNGATHSGAADPAAGALAGLVLRLLQQGQLGQQVEQGRDNRLGAEEDTQLIVRSGRVLVIGARRAQGAGAARFVGSRTVGARHT